jgi:hypothetical protein
MLVHALLEQAIALAHGSLETRDAAAVHRIEAGDQPVEKTAPVAARSREQPIHRRRQPDHLDMLRQCARSRLVSAIDAYGAPRAIATIRSETRADVHRAR